MSQSKEKEKWLDKIENKYHEDVMSTAQLIFCMNYNIDSEEAILAGEMFAKQAKKYRLEHNWCDGKRNEKT